MSLPYSGATSGQRAMEEIHKTLRRFGCTSFGSMTDEENGNLIVQFQFRGTPVSIKASINGYAAAWLKENALKIYVSPERKRKREEEAKRVASLAVYSILRDWIKGQVTAIETGILSFEGAFLGQILLPTGKTVLETAKDQKMLPAPPDEKVVELGRR